MVASSDALGAALGKRAPKTRKGSRILKNRESRAVEEAKTALILAGNKASYEVQTMLKDLHRMRTPLSTLFIRSHEIHPFEDLAKLEVLCGKYSHGLFAFGSTNKKRPFRLILGRLFDNQLLDMQEFSIKEYKPIQSFHKGDCVLGSKPLVLFQGSSFESNESMKRSKSLLLDLFSGPRPNRVMLQGLEQVVVCSAIEAATPSAGSATPILVKRFRMKMTKSASKLPHVDLEEIGPSFKMELDRTRDPDRERWKAAIKVPKEVKAKKVKNMSKDYMGKRRARVHLGKQDFDQIHTVHHGESKRKKLKEGPEAETSVKKLKTKKRRAAARTD
jgi:ribosome production factor 2